jgi:hypothetical protein
LTKEIKFIIAHFYSSHSWANQLVPVLTSAQVKLSDRVSFHKDAERLQNDKLEPAAHLDPGPKGYNIYGGIGFSLSMVPKVLLDKSELTKRLELMRDEAHSNSSKLMSQHVLVECRRLFQRYAASAAIGETPVSIYSDNLAVSTLNKAQLPRIAAAYEKAIELLQGASERDLVLQAMNELGDIMMLSGNVK